MFHIKYFETEEEMQACDDKHQYVAYIENGIKANIHREVPFFCILRLKDGSTVELEGNGEFTQSMISSYKNNVTGAEFGLSCTSIGKNAFYNCKLLKKVTIGNGVKYIGEWAFANTSLTSITIPDNVTSIYSYAFNYCTSLTDITIGKRVNNISDYSFEHCYNLEHITVDPDNKTYDSRDNCNALIGTYNNKLKVASNNTTVIPDTVKTIASYAF